MGESLLSSDILPVISQHTDASVNPITFYGFVKI